MDGIDWIIYEWKKNLDEFIEYNIIEQKTIKVSFNPQTGEFSSEEILTNEEKLSKSIKDELLK